MRALLVFVVLVGCLHCVLSQTPAQVDFTVDLTQPTTPFRHVWNQCVGSGHALLALRYDYRTLLTRAHKDLGLKYVRFHGVLDDDMSTYSTVNGQPQTSFFNVDSVYDFLVSINMKPFIEVSFMPELLASGTETVFHYEGNITPPANSTAWASVITQFVTHLVDRYGVEEVRDWPFEIWNEPNCGFWTGTQQDYFDFYQVTVAAIKSVDPLLKVGGPATCQSQWISEFLNFTASVNAPVDFVSTHEYPTDIQPTYRNVMTDVTKQTRALVGDDMPLYYTEYNDGLYEPPHHDTAYAAAFIAKNAHDVEPYVDFISWWTWSDIFEEQGFSSIPFNDPNGWGLLNRYGIAKPSYRIFQLLNQVGYESVSIQASNDEAKDYTKDLGMWGTIVDTTGGGVRLDLVLYNFDVVDRPMSNLEANIVVSGIDTTTIASQATMYLIDSKHVNPVAAWIEMGSPLYPTKEQLEDLEIASDLHSEPLQYVLSGGSIQLTTVLEPYAVCLIQVQLK